MTDERPEVSDATDRKRYEIGVGGELAGFTQYTDTGARRIFFHTEIDDRFAGQGLASALVSRALEDTRSAGLRIVPVCPYVARYVKKHHGFDDALDPVTPEALAAVRAAQG